MNKKRLNIFKYNPNEHTLTECILEVKEGYSEEHLTTEQKDILFGMKIMLDRVSLESNYYNFVETTEEENKYYTLIDKMKEEVISKYINDEIIPHLINEIAEAIISMVEENTVEGLYDEDGELKKTRDK